MRISIQVLKTVSGGDEKTQQNAGEPLAKERQRANIPLQWTKPMKKRWNSEVKPVDYLRALTVSSGNHQ